jgi:thioredoxin reductase
MAEPVTAALNQSELPHYCDSIQAVKIIAPGIKQKITLHQGVNLESNCFFVATVRQPRSELAREVGVVTNARGAILTDEQGKTSVAGIWAAGDVRPIARQIAVAVGTGNFAALMINRTLETLP